MKLYLVRHGESNYNLKHLCNEIPNENVFLTSLGKEQAKQAREKLKNIKFDKIYISQLRRTRETANIIFPNNEFIVEPRLDDIKTGCEGKSISLYRKRINGDFYKVPKGGESIQQLRERVEEFLKELKGENILIVSHYDVIRAIVAYYENLNFNEMFNVRVPNCSIRIIEIKEK